MPLTRRTDAELVRDILGGDPLMTTEEVAATFRVDTATINRWAAAGKLAAIKTPGNGEWRFRESVIREALQGGAGDGFVNEGQ